MALKQLDNSNISVHLGQTSSYKSTYDPSLLVREPRANNRKHLDINDNDPPFIGYDTWNAYEVSALTNNGMPVTGVAKIVYSSTNKYIVESKSLKLYLNSFNMTKLGNTSAEVLSEITTHIREDLSNLLETQVKVYIFDNQHAVGIVQDPYSEWRHNKHQTLEETYPVKDIIFDVYNESPSLLRCVPSECENGEFYHSALLKSNCRVTSQPDWGDVYIHIKGKTTIDPISLLQYIVSFRDECHFHEEICETIYKRICDLAKPDELYVRCLYARRGGIDINPERVSSFGLLHDSLSYRTKPHIKTPKQ